MKVRLNVKLGDKTVFSKIKDKPNATPERLKEVEKEIQEEYARNRFTKGFTVEVVEAKDA